MLGLPVSRIAVRARWHRAQRSSGIAPCRHREAGAPPSCGIAPVGHPALTTLATRNFSCEGLLPLTIVLALRADVPLGEGPRKRGPFSCRFDRVPVGAHRL